MKAQRDQINRFLRKTAETSNALIENQDERLKFGLELVADLISSVTPQKKSENLIPREKDERRNFFREQLLALTEAIADHYEQVPNASTITIYNFEQNRIAHEINTLNSFCETGLMLDLGCANGRNCFSLSKVFQKIIGVDISPKMIQVATSQKWRGSNATLMKHIDFKIHDLEKGLPFIENESVSMVIMNLGTGSDIEDTRMILHEISRALKPNGRFLISFYNASALFFNLPIIWPLSLEGEINNEDHCLDVHFQDRVFHLHAHSFTVRQVNDLFQKVSTLALSGIESFPTVMTLLPDALLDKQAMETITEIDKRLLDMKRGAYLLVTGYKNS